MVNVVIGSLSCFRCNIIWPTHKAQYKASYQFLTISCTCTTTTNVEPKSNKCSPAGMVTSFYFVYVCVYDSGVAVIGRPVRTTFYRNSKEKFEFK